MIELFGVTQVSLAIYLLWLLVNFRKKCIVPLHIIIAYGITIALFMGLKLRLIPFELGSPLDHLLWGIYNVLYTVTIILYLIHLSKNGRTINGISKV